MGRRASLLGIDIGSTSTKAILLIIDRRVLAGFYTRTAGRPVMATQNLLAQSIAWGNRIWPPISPFREKC